MFMNHLKNVKTTPNSVFDNAFVLLKLKYYC